MHLLLISSGPDAFGGVETLIARMAGWLIAHGHTTTLLCRRKKESLNFMPNGLRILEIGKAFDLMCLPRTVLQIWADLKEPEPDVIKCFELESAWVGTVLSRRLSGRPRVLYGCYIPHWETHRPNPLRLVKQLVFERNMRQCIPNANRLFMNPYQVQILKRRFGNKHDANVCPLPVDGNRFKNIQRSPARGRIVSVGRLDPMKEYNLYMVDIIGQLRAKGMNVTWRVYGDGEFRSAMQQRISTLGLANAISLEGPLPYAEFAKPMSEAYIFVGMGTALVEAAFCRVPNVCAICFDSKGITYGSLADLPFANVGECEPGVLQFSVQGRIEKLLELSAEAYEAESRRQLGAAQIFDVDKQMHKFLDIARSAHPVGPAGGLEVGYTLYRNARRIVDACAGRF
jgi:glycosyltransferase involved in cell wall biosynthesis